MLKKAIIITAFLGIAFQSSALPTLPTVAYKVNNVLNNIIHPIELDRNSIDVEIYTSSVIIQLVDNNNEIVFLVTLSETEFYTINTSAFPLGSYKLIATEDNVTEIYDITLTD